MKDKFTYFGQTETLGSRKSLIDSFPEGAKFQFDHTLSHNPGYISVTASKDAWRAWVLKGTGGTDCLKLMQL